MDNSNVNENVLPNIKIPKEFYVILAIIIFLIVCLCLIYFQVNIFEKQSNSEQEVTNNIFIIFFFLINYLWFMLSFITKHKRFEKTI